MDLRGEVVTVGVIAGVTVYFGTVREETRLEMGLEESEMVAMRIPQSAAASIKIGVIVTRADGSKWQAVEVERGTHSKEDRATMVIKERAPVDP